MDFDGISSIDGHPIGRKGLHVATVRSTGTNDISSIVMYIKVVKNKDGSFKSRARLDHTAFRKYLAEGGTL